MKVEEYGKSNSKIIVMLHDAPDSAHANFENEII